MTPGTRKMVKRPCFSPLAGDSERTKDRLEQIRNVIDLSGGIESMEVGNAKTRKALKAYAEEIQHLRYSDFKGV